MFIKTFLNKFYNQLDKTKSYGTVQSEYILTYPLLKSTNLSNHCEKLIKATIPESTYDIIKDQLNKTFTDVYTRIPTKSEQAVKTEDTFLTGEIDQIALQEELLKYNFFRTPNNQQANDYEYDTYYNRDNYCNCHCRDTINQQYQ